MADNTEKIKTLEEEEKQILLRMDRIMKFAVYWNNKLDDYSAIIARYIYDKSTRRSQQTGDAKIIADFVLETKVKEDTKKDDKRPDIVACFIKDLDVYLACNYFVENTSFQGWGDDAKRSELKGKVLEKFEVLKLKDVHFLEPVGQGHVLDKGHAHRECHSEMQLLKFAKDQGWNEVVIRVSKAPCMFCYVELWRWNEEEKNPSFQEDGKMLEKTSTIDGITNWVPPHMIQLKLDGVDQASSLRVTTIKDLKESTHKSLEDLKKSVEDLNKSLEDSNLKEHCISDPEDPNWNRSKSKKMLKTVMKKEEEKVCKEIHQGEFDKNPGFPGVDVAIQQVKEYGEKLKNLIRYVQGKMFEEFQKLKEMADDKERQAFELRAKSRDHRDDLIKELEILKEECNKEKDKEKPNVPRHKILTLGNSLYVNYSEEAYKLFMNLAEKILCRKTEKHWKVVKIEDAFTAGKLSKI